MKLLVYSAKAFEIPFLNKANRNKHSLSFTVDALTSETAMQALGYDAISIFSGDDASSIVLEKLSAFGVGYIAVRATGYNNIQLKTATKLGIKVANAPNYAPEAIAEHAIALLLALNRKIVLANQQVHNYDFTLDNLTGVNLHGKTMGIIGTGNIGAVMAKIMHGFGCRLVAFDLAPDKTLASKYQLRYLSLEELCRQSDFISLHIPLNAENYALINEERLSWMKNTALLINTARGGIVDHKALLKALKSRTIEGYAADVYAKERGLFFKDHSSDGISDDLFAELMTFNNVLITPHQGFVTVEALERIAEITIQNLNEWETFKRAKNEIEIAPVIL